MSGIRCPGVGVCEYVRIFVSVSFCHFLTFCDWTRACIRVLGCVRMCMRVRVRAPVRGCA